MLKWEYYKRFVERFKKFAVLNNLEFRTAMIIFVVSKVFQGLVIYSIFKLMINRKYADLIILGLIILNWILELKESEGKIKTLIQQEKINFFYKSYTNYSDKKISLGLVVSEVLWNANDLIGVYMPLLLVLFGKNHGVITNVGLTVFSLIFLYAVEVFYLFIFYCRMSQSKKKKHILSIILKTILFCIFLWIGNSVSEFVLSCPLSIKDNAMKELGGWLKRGTAIQFCFEKSHVIMLFTMFSLFVFGFLLYKMVSNSYNKFGMFNSHTTNINYCLYSTAGIDIKDFGIFPLSICGICSGILYNKGCGHSNMTCLIGILLVIYLVPFILDDIFSFHNEISLDNDGKRIYFWKNKIENLLVYKFKIFVHFYMSKIMFFYFLIYLFTLNKMFDFVYILYNIYLILCLLVIGFLEISRAIVNSPQKVTANYEQLKYNKERIMERDTIGGQILFIGILVSIPTILLACGDITYPFYWIMQVGVLIALSILIYYKYAKLCCQIKNVNWLIKLFDEEEIYDISQS